jgi:hypothetical protein
LLERAYGLDLSHNGIDARRRRDPFGRDQVADRLGVVVVQRDRDRGVPLGLGFEQDAAVGEQVAVEHGSPPAASMTAGGESRKVSRDRSGDPRNPALPARQPPVY